MENSRQDAALLQIGRFLKARGYQFITPTPLTHSRVLRRHTNPVAASLRDIYGWNRPFSAACLDPTVFGLMEASGTLVAEGNIFRSRVRFSTVAESLFLHSGYPTREGDAVFFGPDTYRFILAIRAARDLAPGFAPSLILDIGAGSGAGGLTAAMLAPSQPSVILTDVNSLALRYCAINVALNGATQVTIRESDILSSVPERPDFIIANPPYLVDSLARTYRHGGGAWGTELSLRILEESLQRLSGRGMLLLYTGAVIVDGVDMFHRQAVPLLEQFGALYRYSELDPDVFGEELDNPPYTAADRIAAVALIVAWPN